MFADLYLEKKCIISEAKTGFSLFTELIGSE